MLTSPPTFRNAFVSLLIYVRAPLLLGAVAFAAVLRLGYGASWLSIVGTVGTPLLGMTLVMAYVAWRSPKVARRRDGGGV